MVARPQRGVLLLDHHRPYGETATKTLGAGEHVGDDIRPLVGVQMSRASRAGLDLVEDEERPVFVAKLAQPSEEALRWLVHAALALDRLDEHGRSLGTDQRLCGFEISEGSVDHAWQHRTEAIL